MGISASAPEVSVKRNEGYDQEMFPDETKVVKDNLTCSICLGIAFNACSLDLVNEGVRFFVLCAFCLTWLWTCSFFSLFQLEPCMHFFCECCIPKIHPNESGQLLCPTCRKGTFSFEFSRHRWARSQSLVFGFSVHSFSEIKKTLDGKAMTHSNGQIRANVLALKCQCPKHELGCRFAGPLRSYLQTHEGKCDYDSVPCPLGCGDEKLTRKDLQAHVQNSCTKRDVSCVHCHQARSIHLLSIRVVF